MQRERTAFDDEPEPPARGFSNGSARGPLSLSPRALSWSQLCERPEPDYVVKGVIERGSLVEIYGPHSSGKSFFAGDLGLHIAAGWSWRGRRVKQGGVLYIAAEGGTNITRRLKAFAKHHDLNLNQVPIYVVLATTNLLSPAGIEQIITDAAVVRDISVIIVDTASRVMPGGKEDTEDMGRLVAACDTIRDATKAAVVIVHHTGKDDGKGSRGAVLLPAAVDTLIAISRDDVTKTSTATIEKSRDGETDATFSFGLKVIELGIDADGDPVTSCVVDPINEAVKASKPRQKLTDAAKVGFDQLRNCMAEQAQEMPASAHIPAGFKGVTLTSWKQYLEKAGVINPEGNPREQFRRIRVTLQDRGFIGVWDDFVWLSQRVT